MKKILTEKMFEVIKERETSEVIENLLNANHDLPRTHAVILIGFRINDDYKNYSKLLLEEMNKDIHFLNVRLGIKSAWTTAVALIENLKEKDYPKIKEQFDKWDLEERENLLEWLEDFPEHRKILKEGRI